MPPSTYSPSKSARSSSKPAHGSRGYAENMRHTGSPSYKMAGGRKTASTPVYSDKPGVFQALCHRIMMRPLRSLAEVGTLILGGVILLNALFFQSEHHPAPLFAPSLAPEAFSARLPVPQARPSGYFETTTAGNVRPEERPAPLPPSASSLRQDERASLEEAASIPAPAQSRVGESATAAPEPDKTVLAVQRALLRLGFAPREMRLDGIFGGTTRQAIERFERKNGMPVTGDLSARVTKLLSNQSGIVIP